MNNILKYLHVFFVLVFTWSCQYKFKRASQHDIVKEKKETLSPLILDNGVVHEISDSVIFLTNHRICIYRYPKHLRNMNDLLENKGLNDWVTFAFKKNDSIGILFTTDEKSPDIKLLKVDSFLKERSGVNWQFSLSDTNYYKLIESKKSKDSIFNIYFVKGEGDLKMDSVYATFSRNKPIGLYYRDVFGGFYLNKLIYIGKKEMSILHSIEVGRRILLYSTYTNLSLSDKEIKILNEYENKMHSIRENGKHDL